MAAYKLSEFLCKAMELHEGSWCFMQVHVHIKHFKHLKPRKHLKHPRLNRHLRHHRHLRLPLFQTPGYQINNSNRFFGLRGQQLPWELEQLVRSQTGQPLPKPTKLHTQHIRNK